MIVYVMALFAVGILLGTGFIYTFELLTNEQPSTPTLIHFDNSDWQPYRYLPSSQMVEMVMDA